MALSSGVYLQTVEKSICVEGTRVVWRESMDDGRKARRHNSYRWNCSVRFFEDVYSVTNSRVGGRGGVSDSVQKERLSVQKEASAECG